MTTGLDETLDVPVSDRVAESGELGPGSTIGHFVIRERLGAGGMGVVYAGEDLDLRRPVAIKLVRDGVGHDGYRARLLREAQAMARLEHPNVVRVYEVAEHRGRLFVAMELIDGITLTRWLQTGQPWRDVVAMFIAVGDGLAAVHRAGLVHRDFKPDNVLVDRADRARVADFGLARIDAAAGPAMTQSGALLGTPGYMAPEQQFAPHVDARADQYSFCVALREALAGRPSNEARWRALPEPLRAAVTRGLAFEPGDRFPSLDALLDALRAAAGHARPRARWPIAIAALATLVAGIVAVPIVTARHDDPAASSPAASSAQHSVASSAPGPAVSSAPNPAASTAPNPAASTAPNPASTAPNAASTAPNPASTAPNPATPVPSGQPPGMAPFAAAPPPCCPPHKPAANRDDPGHLPLYRAITRQLGYDGFGAADAPEAVQLGMAARRSGDCAAAIAHFTEALATLGRDDDTARRWRARAQLDYGICELITGHADAAYEHASAAWSDGNQDHITLVLALASYDRGDASLMLGQVTAAQRPHADPLYQAALTTLIDGTGFRIDCVKCAAPAD